MASKSGVRGRGTKEAPLSVQSLRKRLDLGSSGEIQGNLCSLMENSFYKLPVCFRFAVALCFLASLRRC